MTREALLSLLSSIRHNLISSCLCLGKHINPNLSAQQTSLIWAGLLQWPLFYLVRCHCLTSLLVSRLKGTHSLASSLSLIIDWWPFALAHSFEMLRLSAVDTISLMMHRRTLVFSVATLALLFFPSTTTAYKAKTNGQAGTAEPLVDAKIIEIEHSAEPKAVTSFESCMWFSRD